MNALERLARALEKREEKARRGNNASQLRSTGGLWSAINVLSKKSWFSQPTHYHDSERFGDLNDNVTSPATWVAAAPADQVNQYEGWWGLNMLDAGAPVSWLYYRQSAVNVEADVTPDEYAWFRLGGVCFSVADWQCDLEYHFGIVKDTGGAPDFNNWLRVTLAYDYTGGAGWRVRGEKNEATVHTTGNWTALTTAPVVQPLWFVLKLWNDAAGTVQLLWSPHPHQEAWQVLYTQTVSFPWGQGHWYIGAERSAGDSNPIGLHLAGVDAWAN
jgi:hypothetical protein